MLKELDTYDWEEVFDYAVGFTRENCKEVVYQHEGEADTDDWAGIFLLDNGKYAYITAWCDYTGWGCREGGSSEIFDSKQDAIVFGLTDEQRRIFNIEGKK